MKIISVNKEKEKTALQSTAFSNEISNNIIIQKNNNIKIWRDDFLDQQEFKSDPFLIDGLLYNGVTLLVGNPKRGKSLLAEQIAHAIASGTNLWGQSVTQGSVLYFNLEVSDKDAQKRRKTMELIATKHLHYIFDTTMKITDLESFIKDFCCQIPDLKLVILDTFHRLREIKADTLENSYNLAVREINILQEISSKYDLAFIAVCHSSKESNEPIGSNGLYATATAKLTLIRDETSSYATLYQVSRFHPTTSFSLKLNEKPLQWTMESANKEVLNLPPIVTYILKFLSECKDYSFSGTANELWKSANLHSLYTNPKALSQALNTYQKSFDENSVSIHRRKSNGKKILELVWTNL